MAGNNFNINQMEIDRDKKYTRIINFGQNFNLTTVNLISLYKILTFIYYQEPNQFNNTVGNNGFNNFNK